MLLKKFLCLLLVFAFTVMSLASCAGNGETQTSADIITTTIGTTSTTQAAATTQTTVTTVTTEKPQDPVLSTQSEEVLTAQELGLIPSNWASDLTKSASFGGFYTMMVRLIELCDESCADEWEAAIDQKNYPARAMLRDDALVMIAGTMKMSMAWFIPSIIVGRGIGTATIVFGLSFIPFELLTTPWHWIGAIAIFAVVVVGLFFGAFKLNKYMEKRNNLK